MKRYLSYVLFLLATVPALAQKMSIITTSGATVEVEIIPDSARKLLLQQPGVQLDNTLRKQWTARTYRLPANHILVEFYDREAALINNLSDFKKLQEVRFIKNYIDFLKKNISYKIELPYERGKELAATARRLSKLKGDHYQVYQMPTGQILFMCDTPATAAIYENLKALSSENNHVQDQYFEGHWESTVKKLVSGDPMFDYEPNEHLVHPKDLTRLIKNHKLSLLETKVYVSTFHGNLYQSANGYYVLIDEVYQPNGAGERMPILTVRIYEDLKDLTAARARYEKLRKEGVRSEHFYQKMSNKYGIDFPAYASRLIDSLPSILNFDKEQLSFDSAGMDIVDEAILWNHHNYALFEEWLPCVLAYYGKCYMIAKKDGQWVVKKTPDDVLAPYLVLSDGTNAFDIYEFYKALYEWPVSIKFAGDWYGWSRNMKAGIAPARLP